MLPGSLIIQAFILLTVSFVGYGIFVIFMGSKLPKVISQAYAFGKLQKKGKKNIILEFFEMPKKWFQHFYTLGVLVAIPSLFFMATGVLQKKTSPEIWINILDFFGGGKERQVEVDSTWGLIAFFLFTMQICRRFYETYFVQSFSSKSRMSIFLWIVGMAHYLFAPMALLANTEGFVQGTIPSSISIANSSPFKYISVIIFGYSWYHQYRSNMILANLRKDKTGKVVSEKHYIPSGGYFDVISSPHMFFEVCMYFSIAFMAPKCLAWYFVSIWVLANQVLIAYMGHKCYQETFSDYPKNRYAIIPYVI